MKIRWGQECTAMLGLRNHLTRRRRKDRTKDHSKQAWHEEERVMQPPVMNIITLTYQWKAT